MLHVSTWFWGNKYPTYYLDRLNAAVARNLTQPFVWHILQPLQEDAYLLEVRGCFPRLRMFDPSWQRSIGMREGDRLLNVDVDTIVLNELDPLVNRPEPFVIMQGGNAANPCPYNGALMMIEAGAHPEVWTDFNLTSVQDAPFHEFPDDQGWLWHKLPNAAGWKCGPATGVYVFRKTAWGEWGDEAPPGARLVTFAGKRRPDDVWHMKWVQENWR